jgi:hypothetical protein
MSIYLHPGDRAGSLHVRFVPTESAVSEPVLSLAEHFRLYERLLDALVKAIKHLYHRPETLPGSSMAATFAATTLPDDLHTLYPYPDPGPSRATWMDILRSKQRLRALTIDFLATQWEEKVGEPHLFVRQDLIRLGKLTNQLVLVHVNYLQRWALALPGPVVHVLTPAAVAHCPRGIAAALHNLHPFPYLLMDRGRGQYERIHAEWLRHPPTFPLDADAFAYHPMMVHRVYAQEATTHQWADDAELRTRGPRWAARLDRIGSAAAHGRVPARSAVPTRRITGRFTHSPSPPTLVPTPPRPHPSPTPTSTPPSPTMSRFLSNAAIERPRSTKRREREVIDLTEEDLPAKRGRR